MSGRYNLVSVGVGYNDSTGGSFDDPDEAIIACDAYHDVYDRRTGQWLTPSCAEEVNEAKARLSAKAETPDA
jgi:nitrite reductase/ring-hydroxylating ferredoxin subunit